MSGTIRKASLSVGEFRESMYGRHMGDGRLTLDVAATVDAVKELRSIIEAWLAANDETWPLSPGARSRAAWEASG